jgi:hypothetical protein
MPGCDHAHDSESLILASRCHPSSGTTFSINVAQKTMQVVCATCSKPIIVINCGDELESNNRLLPNNKDTN